MGCNNSKAVEGGSNPAADARRAKQAEKRKKSQAALRPDTNTNEADKLATDFSEKALAMWPSRPPWFKKGQHQQGIGILVAAPQGLKDTVVNIVRRNELKYTVDLGYGKETKYDPQTGRMSITCSTVSMSHARLHFKRHNQQSTVHIEDLGSLNGTFVLARPSKNSNKRPMLQKEVEKNKMVDLRTVEYIRLGAACVLALDCTNIYWDDEGDSDMSEEELPEGQKRDEVKAMFDDEWYMPTPCPPKVAEITSKGREVADDPSKGKVAHSAHV